MKIGTNEAQKDPNLYVAFCVQGDKKKFVKALAKKTEKVFDGILTPKNNENNKVNVVLYNLEIKGIISFLKKSLPRFRRSKAKLSHVYD